MLCLQADLKAYPGVPREEVGFRIQVTAANTDDQVVELLATLERLADVVALRAAGSCPGDAALR